MRARARAAERRTRPGRIEVTRRTRRKAPEDRELRRIARAALEFGNQPGASLSLVLLDDRALARLHGRWMGDPSRTDVITFDLREPGIPEAPAGPMGELCISVECARREARRRGVRVERELALYVVHGVLHLCGFDDRTARQRREMRAAERRVLARLGFEDDPTPFE